jgi:hypothetical protein
MVAERLRPVRGFLIVKRYAAAVGFDPNAFAGHSLRAGFLTALEDGADMFRVMDVTRHRRVETHKGYHRRPGCAPGAGRKPASGRHFWSRLVAVASPVGASKPPGALG